MSIRITQNELLNQLLLIAKTKRFLKHVYKTDDPSICWLWNNKHNENRPTFDGHTAARFAYELWVDPIPEGLWVLHKCDVEDCVNPEHLYTGTPTDNNRDTYERKRRKPPNKSKVSEEIRKAIRLRLAMGAKVMDLACEYRLTTQIIRYYS